MTFVAFILGLCLHKGHLCPQRLLRLVFTMQARTDNFRERRNAHLYTLEGR